MKRYERYTAAAVAWLVLACGPALAAKWPEWAEAAEAEYCESCFEDEDGVMILNSWELKLRNGERRGLRRRLIRVHNEDGREAAAVYFVNTSFERCDDFRLWVRDPGGAVQQFRAEDGTLGSMVKTNTLEDTTILAIAPAGVVPGSVVAAQCDMRRTAEWPQDILELQSSVPVARAIVSLESRDDWSVSIRVAGTETPEPFTVDKKKIWDFRDLPALPSDWPDYAPRPPSARMALSYAPPGSDPPFGSWRTMAQWFGDFFKAASPGEALAGEFEELGPDPVLAVGREARGVRYFAVELGWGGFIPRTPSTTLKRGFGDCKDKTQLMLTLLRGAGVEAFPVLAMAPSDGHVPDEMPGQLFNHVIVGIPWSGRDRSSGMTIADDPNLGPLRLYDPTLPLGAAQDIGLALEGGAGLVLHPGTDAVLRFPGSTGSENVLEEIHEVYVESEGTVRFETTVIARGAMRRFFEGADGSPRRPVKLRKELYRRLASIDPEFHDLEIDEAQLGEDGSWTYAVKYASPGRLSKFGELRVLELDGLLALRSLPIVHDEAGVVHLPLRGTFRDETRLHLGGWEVAGLDKPVEVDSSVGKLKLATDRNGADLKVERVVLLEADTASVDQAEDIALAKDALRRINRAAIILRRKP